VTRLSLVRWALLQYLIGNSDAHGKNVSFYSWPNGLELAPFYDLVSVVQYPHYAHELAMAFGDEFTIEAMRPYDWASFARDTKTPRSLLAREMRRMGTTALQTSPELAAAATYVGDERELVRRITEYVQRQAQNLLDMARPTLQVEDESL
jgi:serine/threonine-protein kinase HipA